MPATVREAAHRWRGLPDGPTRDGLACGSPGHRPVPFNCVPLWADSDLWEWVVRPEGGVITEGQIYTDGSLFHAAAEYEGHLVRAAWAFAVIGGDGTVIAIARGMAPHSWIRYMGPSCGRSIAPWGSGPASA